MSLSTYTGLKAAMESWLNREGMSSLTDQSELLVELAQRRVHRDCDLHAMEAVETLTLDAPDVYLPQDFLRVKSLRLLRGNGSYEIQGASLASVLDYSCSGTPNLYAVVNNQLYLGPPPSSSYEAQLFYYRALPILSSTVTSNWLSVNAPELLLWGGLMEASLFLKDDQRAQLWEARYSQVRDETLRADDRAGREPGSMQMRIM